jgi:hypothetical protein
MACNKNERKYSYQELILLKISTEMYFRVSKIKCIIFKENNDNPYENYNNYIKLSIVFHPMIFF